MEKGKQQVDTSLPLPEKHHDFILTNGDTDSIAFKKQDEKPFTKEEIATLISEINGLMPKRIVWEDDGHYRRFIVLRAKNYLMDDGKKVKIKGSALKASMKEVALKEFISEALELFRTDRKAHLYRLYEKYAQEAMSVTDISRWCFKKTITKKLMNGTRKNETRVMDALEGSAVNEGDKVFVFVKEVIDWGKAKKEQKIYEMRENFTGQYCRRTLLRKLHDTLCVFETIVDAGLFPNYSQVTHMELVGLEKPRKAKNEKEKTKKEKA